jgi:basic amino acid/polyamine antiporter, APA family
VTQPALVRRLGLFDATMLVMGGIIGSGIFLNPAEVARHVSTPALIVGAWLIGGAIAIAGAFVYAELAARRPEVGGQYAYLRDAWGPMPAFLYGWSLLLVIQSGGMAAVAIIFAHYLLELTHWPVADGAVAAAALALLTAINCLGVRAGATVQSALMVLKIGAVLGLVAAGWLLLPPAPSVAHPMLDRPPSFGLLTAMGAALVPVLFAYGGWQTASFVAAELRRPERDLPRGLLLGVSGVIVLYLSVNAVCVRALGPDGLAATTTPASTLMRLALGEKGARLIAAGIAISTLGFLSQGILTAPRVYYAMAEDGVFFRAVGFLHPRTLVPVVAIAVQGLVAAIIAVSGRYEQILNYVVSVDFIFFGATGASLFVFRRRQGPAASFRTPGHPATTIFFVAACFLVVINTVYTYPAHTVIGLAILLAGIPIFFMWRRPTG